VTFLHWGGGSPSMLEPADWRRLMARLRARFDIAARADIAVELDPRTAGPDLIATLAGTGVTRASLGVQDFDPLVQAAIHRVQPYEMVADVTAQLGAAGIGAVNFDLIYGLPYQTVEGVARTAGLAAGLAPARLALFGYAHVPWMKPHQRRIPEDALPDAVARFEQAEAAAEVLVAAGYVRIGLDHFARPDDPLAQAAAAGRLHRNFQGYTEDPARALLGFGASAIGQLPQGYVQNHVAIPDWRAAVEAGALPVARGYALTAEDRLRGEVIERLMCDLEVDLDAVAARHGAAGRRFDAERAHLAGLAADGLVELDGRRVRITPPGRPFMRLAAAAFDARFAPVPQRHARAV
jgi:oxygen-independent coproporphyrinogen-3 oxidase